MMQHEKSPNLLNSFHKNMSYLLYIYDYFIGSQMSQMFNSDPECVSWLFLIFMSASISLETNIHLSDQMNEETEEAVET